MVSTVSEWSCFTNHGRALLCLAETPDMRLRELADCLGVTERAAQRIVGELCDSGHITKRRAGRRNEYALVSERVVPDGIGPDWTVGELAALLTESAANGRRPERRGRGDRRGGGRRASDRAAS